LEKMTNINYFFVSFEKRKKKKKKKILGYIFRTNSLLRNYVILIFFYLEK